MPPQLGRDISRLYRKTNQAGNLFIELGETIFPAGEMPPEPNESFKKLGETFPYFGKGSPTWGKRSPTRGRVPPTWGKRSPRFGMVKTRKKMVVVAMKIDYSKEGKNA